MATETLNLDVVALVREVLRQEMEPFGLTEVEVSLGPDHDGDPNTQVDASYDGRRPVDPKVMAGLLTKLRNRLWERGERRFPYIRHHFPEHQKVVGFK